MVKKQNPQLEDELNDIRKKFPDLSFAELSQSLKKVVSRGKYAVLAESLDELFTNMKFDVDKSRFAQECKKAWDRKYPNGLAKKVRKPNEYSKFLKVTLPEVVKQFPQENRKQWMSRVATQWKELTNTEKQTDNITETEVQDSQDSQDCQEGEEVGKSKKKNTRAKRQRRR